jgi:hypothetical protein
LRFGGLPQVLWCFFFVIFFFSFFYSIFLYLNCWELIIVIFFNLLSMWLVLSHELDMLTWIYLDCFFFIQFCSLTLSCFKIEPHILFLQIFFYLEIIVFLIRSIYYHTLFFCLKIILLNSIRSITYCHFFIFFLFYN